MIDRELKIAIHEETLEDTKNSERQLSELRNKSNEEYFTKEIIIQKEQSRNSVTEKLSEMKNSLEGIGNRY